MGVPKFFNTQDSIQLIDNFFTQEVLNEKSES